MDGFHKLIIMGISASVGLSIFLFNLGWDVILGLQDDVTVIGQDVAYIKGRIELWDSNYSP